MRPWRHNTCHRRFRDGCVRLDAIFLSTVPAAVERVVAGISKLFFLHLAGGSLDNGRTSYVAGPNGNRLDAGACGAQETEVCALT